MNAEFENQYKINFDQRKSEFNKLVDSFINNDLNKELSNLVDRDTIGLLKKTDGKNVEGLEERIKEKVSESIKNDIELWKKEADEIYTKIFKNINEKNPNTILTVKSYLEDLQKNRMVRYHENMNSYFIGEAYNSLNGFMRDNNAIGKFTKAMQNDYIKTLERIDKNIEGKKDDYVRKQREDLLTHLESKDLEEKMGEAVDINQIETLFPEIELTNLETKQEKEIFGLTTDELITRSSSLFEIVGVNLSIDKNGKVVGYKEGEATLTSEELEGKLIFNNENNQFPYVLRISGEDKSEYTLMFAGGDIRWDSINNKYIISTTEYVYTIDAIHKIFERRDKKEEKSSYVPIEYEQMRDELRLKGIETDKIKGLDLEMPQR